MKKLNEDILELLVCPKTKLPLRYASQKQVMQTNRLAENNSLSFVNGLAVNDTLTGLLIRSDDAIAYGIFDDIPNLLAQEGIPLNKV